MNSASHRPGLRLSSGYLALTMALVIMVVLVAGAARQALRAEASNHATAERMLRDYSAFAAWNFTEQANVLLHNLGGPGMSHVDPGNGNPAAPVLPHPSVLISLEPATSHPTGEATPQFAFRIDLPEGGVVTAGASPGEAALAELAHKLPPLMRTGGPERHRFAAPTIGGRAMRLAVTLIVATDSSRTPRAIFGVALDSAQFARALRPVIDSDRLLPPVLVGREPLGDRVYIAVRAPDGAVLFASRTNPPSSIVATDTVVPEQGRLLVSASIDPTLAPALVIGGLPSSRLPALFALLGAGLLLAAVGFAQLRRERELMRLRSRFVANVSHELRTPLAQISMFGETLMLGRARTAQEQHHFASVIHREAGRLTALVEKLLRFSSAEAGGAALHLEDRNLADELREAIDDFTPLARAADARLRLESDATLMVSVDPSALRQVVMNLLENAVKYGPRGQQIVVTAEARGVDAQVAVEDEGPGVPPSDRARVLLPFTRLERADQPNVAGTGIGLTVVSELVRAHGGRLWIEEAPGGGARVCFTVRRIAADMNLPPSSPHAEQGILSTGR